MEELPPPGRRRRPVGRAALGGAFRRRPGSRRRPGPCVRHGSTTRLSIALLADVERGSCLDAGCGSGVVAVAAVRLGFAPVVALDLDPEAVVAAEATARRNDVVVDVRRSDVLRDELPATDVAVANIELAVVESLLGRVPAKVAVTSGYLAHEAPTASGWECSRRLELEDWAADLLVRL